MSESTDNPADDQQQSSQQPSTQLDQYNEDDLFGDMSDDEATTTAAPTDSTIDNNYTALDTNNTTNIDLELFGEDSDNDQLINDNNTDTNNEHSTVREQLLQQQQEHEQSQMDLQHQAELLAHNNAVQQAKQATKPVAKNKPLLFSTNNIIGNDTGNFIDKVSLIPLPNVIQIQPQSFARDTYTIESIDNTNTNERKTKQLGVAGSARLGVENVMRWRYTGDGDEKQSNSRLVEWSDGSVSLMIGSEIFDVMERPFIGNVKYDNYIFQSINHNKLTYSHTDDSIQQSYALLHSILKFKVTSINSKTHQKLNTIAASLHKQQPKIKRAAVSIDPEKQKQLSLQLAKQDELKQKRLLAREQRMNNRQSQYTQRSSKLSSEFLEASDNDEDEDEDERDLFDSQNNISAMKRRNYNDDESGSRLSRIKQQVGDNSDDEIFDRRRNRPSKRNVSDDESNNELNDTVVDDTLIDNDDDDDAFNVTTSNKQSKRRKLGSDAEHDDSD